jgi:thiamine pyrophosphate-dependent acetolactate synthase large subunit-like protein
MGDLAFGFSAMEYETLTRYRMGAVIFIINNIGIYSGVNKLEGDPKNLAVTSELRLGPAEVYFPKK